MLSSTMHSVGVNSTLLMTNIDETEKPITLCFPEQVMFVSFAPYEECHDLAIIVFREDLSISSIKFQEESSSILEPVQYKELQSVKLPRVLHVSWSPESSLTSAPYQIEFACTTKDEFDIKIFRSNIVDEYTDKILCVHSSYINAIAYEPSGSFMCSTSDDLTCRVWDARNSYESVASFYLLSPGVTLSWHRTRPGVFLVGEKSGCIRVYNAVKKVAILSVETELGPLSIAAWIPMMGSKSNPDSMSSAAYIAALCGQHLLVWSTAYPVSLVASKPIHGDVGGRLVDLTYIRGSSSPKIVTIGPSGGSGYSLRVITINCGKGGPNSETTVSPLSVANLKLATNISTHAALPYIAVGVHRQIFFWKTTNF